VRLNPNHYLPLVNLAWAYLEWNRFAEAKAVSESAIAQGLGADWFHGILYRIAFVQGDPVAMQNHADWARGRPTEFSTLFAEGSAAMFSGRLQKGEEHFRRAVELALRTGLKETAAASTASRALLDAICGNFHQAQVTADSALRIERSRSALQQAAIALALSGDTRRAQAYIDELARRQPSDFWVNDVALPQMRAAIEIKHGNPSKAIELLGASTPYELSYAAPLQPIYVRGQAYLSAKQGKEAAAEFQKILDHRGVSPISPLYALAYLGLARAWAQAGDATQSRRAYQDFLALWKDADPDIPVLIEAKAEYARLK
jgi:tetratricopeptide (TPR) repeat protein